ncbi:hypothetical protein TNCV_2041911 [Trichonephila clavipes]|nr:hypothetical protein TNCV_2041911 [Trichonephila clavipes]
MDWRARKTTPWGKRATLAPIPKSAMTKGVTNHFRNMILTFRNSKSPTEGCAYVSSPDYRSNVFEVQTLPHDGQKCSIPSGKGFSRITIVTAVSWQFQ